MYILYIYFRSTSYFQTASSWRFPKMVRSKGIGPVVSLMSHLVEWEYLVVNPIYPGYPWMESGWVLHGPPKFSSPCKDHRTSSWIITCVKGTLPFQRCAKGSSSWCTCKLICMLESISFFLSFFSFWFVSFSISLSLSLHWSMSRQTWFLGIASGFVHAGNALPSKGTHHMSWCQLVFPGLSDLRPKVLPCRGGAEVSCSSLMYLAFIGDCRIQGFKGAFRTPKTGQKPSWMDTYVDFDFHCA